MNALVALTASLAGGTVLLAASFIVGMRTKNSTVQSLVRRSSRFMKPFVLRSAGRPGSPTAVVEHVGRVSGRTHETPVVAARTSTGFAIALPYGPTTDWVKNVMHAGGATLRVDGTSYVVDRPRVVELEAVGLEFARREQRLHRQFAVRDALLLRTARALDRI